MKIAELFYPKELKGIIKNLRDDNKLSEEALIKVNKYIIRKILFGVGFSLIFTFSSLALNDYRALIFINLLVAYSIYSFIKDIYFDLSTYPILYSVGNQTSGNIERVFDTGLITVSPVCAWRIKYKYQAGSILYSGDSGYLINYFYRDRYQVGDKVTVYYKTENPEKSIPHISSFYSLFNLKREEGYV